MKKIGLVVGALCLLCVMNPTVSVEAAKCSVVTADCGDVNASGEVTATDALAVLRFAVGLVPPETLDCPVFECDDEGCTDITGLSVHIDEGTCE